MYVFILLKCEFNNIFVQSCTDIYAAGLRPDETNNQEADSDSLKVLFKSLLTQLDEVKHRLLVLGEGPWLYDQTISKETQTETEFTPSPTLRETSASDSKTSQTPPNEFAGNPRKDKPSVKEGGGVFTRKPKDTKQSPHSIRRYRRSRDLSNFSNQDSTARKGTSEVSNINSRVSQSGSRDSPDSSTSQRNQFESSDSYRAAYLNNVESPASRLQNDEDSRFDEFHESYEAFNNRNSSDGSNFDVEEENDEEDTDKETAESYDLSENLSLYVPEPSDHTCYISFGDNSPSSSPRIISTVQSPGSQVKLFSPRVDFTSEAAPVISKLKSPFSSSSDCINAQTQKQSLEIASAPDPPSKISKRSVSSVVVGKYQSDHELRDRTLSFESNASGTLTNTSTGYASFEVTPTTPEGLVPGAVKARRAMFETHSKQENGFDVFKLRKTSSSSKEGSSGGGIFWGKSKIAKSASTSDLVIITNEDGENVHQSEFNVVIEISFLNILSF